MGTVRTEPDEVCPQIGSAALPGNTSIDSYRRSTRTNLISLWEVTFEDESCKILIFDRRPPPRYHTGKIGLFWVA